jgi:hypothetical protein
MEDVIHELSSDNCETRSPRDVFSPSLIPRPSPYPLPSIFSILLDLVTDDAPLVADNSEPASPTPEENAVPSPSGNSLGTAFKLAYCIVTHRWTPQNYVR